MTDELISRQEAMVEVTRFLGYLDEDMIERINIGLMRLPTIEERKKGEWLRYNENGDPCDTDTFYWQCDQCLSTQRVRKVFPPNFCPNCGADMRGEGNETD